jgi:hypothetical protein
MALKIPLRQEWICDWWSSQGKVNVFFIFFIPLVKSLAMLLLQWCYILLILFCISGGTPSKKQSPCTHRSEAPTTPTTTTTNADSCDKENVEQKLIRRSLGATPGRRSFVPVIPSPLLKDGTTSSADGSEISTSPSEKVAAENMTTPVRSGGRRYVSGFCYQHLTSLPIVVNSSVDADSNDDTGLKEC